METSRRPWQQQQKLQSGPCPTHRAREPDLRFAYGHARRDCACVVRHPCNDMNIRGAVAHRWSVIHANREHSFRHCMRGAVAHLWYYNVR